MEGPNSNASEIAQDKIEEILGWLDDQDEWVSHRDVEGKFPGLPFDKLTGVDVKCDVKNDVGYARSEDWKQHPALNAGKK